MFFLFKLRNSLNLLIQEFDEIHIQKKNTIICTSFGTKIDKFSCFPYEIV